MPLIEYKCKCGYKESKLVSNKELKKLSGKLPCPNCENPLGLVRQLGAGTSNSKMVIDNGTMARSIEVLRNVQEIREQISNKNKKISKIEEEG